MQTKLTLRLDDQLIAQAKSHAQLSGKSLSQMVAEYFQLIGRPTTESAELTPVVARLKGALRGAGVDVDDFRAHLVRKHQ